MIVFEPAAIAPMKLLALTLPLKLPVPATLAPVPVMVNVVLPTAATVTFPFADAMYTLLFPFANVPMILPVNLALPPASIEYALVIVALVPAVGPAAT